MPYPFLSDEWLAEARRIRGEYESDAAEVATEIDAMGIEAVRMNLVVTEVPFGSGQIEAHLATTQGEIELETGHVGEPHLTVTVDYLTAKAMLVDGDAGAAMQAFMAGKVRVEGDMAKLMALQAAPASAGPAMELASRLRAITE